MKYFFQLFFILSFIFADNHYTKCGFLNEMHNHTRFRPTNDTYAPSPNNLFYIHYDVNGNDAPSQIDNNSNGVPDYVDEVGIAAEHSLDVIVNQLGFDTFPPDDDGIYDIYIEDMGSGYYGVNIIDVDYMGNNLGGSSYIKIDNEYEQGEYYTTGLDGMRVTVVHEFFHAIQRSYQIYPTGNGFLYELTSTWIEDIAYPDNNDYIYWTDNFFDNPEQSIDQTDGYSVALYGHYLTSEFNDNIIREIWERFKIINNAMNSIDYVIDNNYNSTFIETWVDFCSRNFFNGEYLDLNNNFYYYSDQIYADPITFNVSEPLSGNISIANFVLSDESIRIKLFEPTSNIIIDNMQASLTSGTLIGNFVLASNILNNQNIINVDNSTGLCTPVEQIYMVLASSENSIADIDITTTTSIVYADFNQDCQTNILDVIILVDIILNNYNGGQIIPNDLLDASDLDLNGNVDILDIVLLINEIMDI